MEGKLSKEQLSRSTVELLPMRCWGQLCRCAALLSIHIAAVSISVHNMSSPRISHSKERFRSHRAKLSSMNFLSGRKVLRS